MKENDPYTDLLLRHRKLIWRLCRRYAKGDDDRCNDLVQEVSIALWERYGRLRSGASHYGEMGWVYWNTRNVLYNMHRGKHLSLVSLTSQMDDLIDTDEDYRGQANDLLVLLDPDERQLMQLRLDGYSFQEIAAHYHLSTDATYKRIARIIEKIKKELDHEQRNP